GVGWYEKDAREHAPVLPLFAPFSGDEVVEAFDRAETGWWPESRLLVADALAPHLSDQQLTYILGRLRVFPLEEACFAALADVGQLQSRRARDETAERALALAEDIRSETHQARCVAAIAPILWREDLAAKAFGIVRSISDWFMRRVPAMDALA